MALSEWKGRGVTTMFWLAIMALSVWVVYVTIEEAE